MTAGLLLIKSVLRPLAKSFDSLELTTVMSAKDAAIKKKKKKIIDQELQH